ncbi:hypothetical protein BD410DRAFT_730008 [Rickenella mellea]|uniref:Uncharacterized protein n=1 Tax=Rickenella mellea TaxID=50990 RepID=A0A4Y7PPS7_9AGAM|nr:hypothetical protein BD410DRAFT_730008 [Rickenella mellea]
MSFDDVLGTNYVPTHIERCSIKVLIESKEQELSSLNHDMSPLLQIAMGDRVADSILGHTALLAPVRRMPPELISEVFIRTINSAIIPDRQRPGKSKRD